MSSTSQGMVGTYSQGNKPEQREVQLGERVHARHAAQVERHFARPQHAPVGHRHAGELEREVGLDGGVDLGRAAVVNVPAAVGQLHGEDVIDRLALPFRVHLARPSDDRQRCPKRAWNPPSIRRPSNLRASGSKANTPAPAQWRLPHQPPDGNRNAVGAVGRQGGFVRTWQTRPYSANPVSGCKVLILEGTS